MKEASRRLSLFLFLLFFPFVCSASSAFKGVLKAPQPVTCLSATVTISGSTWWKNVTMALQNKCGQTVDVKNTTITFNNPDNLNTAFWGAFGAVSYPDNNLQITSQPSGSGYLSTLYFHIPDGSWSNSQLANNGIIYLYWGSPTAAFDPASTLVYLGYNPAPTTGNINLVNMTSQPTDVSQTSAPVNVLLNGQLIQSIQLPWQGSQMVSGLNPGNYTIQANNVSGSQNTYQGTANPAAVTVTAGQTVSSMIQYAAVVQNGAINISVPAMPSQLNGYTGTPVVTLTRTTNGNTTTANANWNAITTVKNLTNTVTYNLSTPNIVFNNYSCAGTLNPASVVSNASTPPTVSLSYQCTSINQVNVGLSVNGLTSAQSSVNVVLTPNNGTMPVTAQVNLTNGSGTSNVTLTKNVIYSVASTAVTGFNTSFNPQPLTATSGATETIAYSAVLPPSSGGRTIGYLTGWKTPPTVTDLANAGYTHLLVAFGLFSTTSAGTITDGAFNTLITPSYIGSLHAAGIKVLLSVGGASTSIPNTTVNFHQALSMASSPAAFQTAVVQSIESLAKQYGFDGVDFDIEQGFGVGGTMASPTGDVAVLANIINQLHTDNPAFMVSLAPQTANISATSGFDATWGNYAALIMQTYNALTWVGVQLYNTGCMFGIDHVCYDPNNTASPNFSVAMGTDMLESWPSQINGQPTGFQPYVGHLRADQIVLGYPSPNSSGGSDGAPTTPTSTIKRAIQCFQTGVAASNSCDTYVPPKKYGLIGGVFNWEVSYDQTTGFNFAKSLKSCVTTGACT